MNRKDRRTNASSVPRAQKLRQEQDTRRKRHDRLVEETREQAQKRRVRLPLLAATAQGRLDNDINKTKPDDTTCTQGCSACCKELAMISLSEALLILENYPEEVEAARERIKQAVLRGQTALPYATVNPVQHPDRLVEMAQAWWTEQVDCPLLDQTTKLCTVYESRPLACRQRFSLSDPIKCADLDINESTIGWAPERVAEITWALWQKEQEEMGQVIMGPLANILATAETGLRVLRTTEETLAKRTPP